MRGRTSANVSRSSGRVAQFNSPSHANSQSRIEMPSGRKLQSKSEVRPPVVAELPPTCGAPPDERPPVLAASVAPPVIVAAAPFVTPPLLELPPTAPVPPALG